MAGLWRQFWRFGLSGIAGLGADVAVLYIALALGSGYFPGRAISFLVAVFVTWQLNRRFAFRAAAGASSWDQWWRYLGAMAGGGAVNYVVYGAAIITLPPGPALPLYAVALGSLAGMCINFAAARSMVFRQ
ncbi:MAG: GtrA family protein [Pseudomonadota bacterium]